MEIKVNSKSSRSTSPYSTLGADKSEREQRRSPHRNSPSSQSKTRAAENRSSLRNDSPSYKVGGLGGGGGIPMPYCRSRTPEISKRLHSSTQFSSFRGRQSFNADGSQSAEGMSLLTGFGQDFKQQLMQYLEVLKDKVTDMEVKTKEQYNEKNFYK